MTRSRPSIFQVGTVRDDGHTVFISGWGLGLCARQCVCHRHPTGGFLSVVDDRVRGTLGLRCFYPSGACDCCEPWTAGELTAVLQYMADLEHVPTVAEGA